MISKRTTGAVDGVNAHGSVGLNVAVSWCIPGGKINGPLIAVPLVTLTIAEVDARVPELDGARSCRGRNRRGQRNWGALGDRGRWVGAQ